MSTPMSTTGFQRVRTEAGWHLRFVAGNHEPIVVSEVYDDPASVTLALEVISEWFASHPSGSYAVADLTDIDERPGVVLTPESLTARDASGEITHTVDLTGDPS